ncbi:metallophosphoesterase family protein [Candidatus Similichlamydia laticola]|nr:metallophosphoesterase [Candidatus Similichlamydia laticola]
MNDKSMPLCFAHLSDLHFFSTEWNLALFSSPRARSFLAQLHALLPFSSRKQFPGHAKILSEFLKNHSPPLDFILISGDLTTKGSAKECALARSWLKTTDPIPKIIIPGNHDVFQKGEKQFPFETLLLLNGFGFDPKEFSEKSCTLLTLPQGWRFLLLDLTHPKIGHAQGLFSKELEKQVDKILAASSGPCIVSGHFPLYGGRTKIRSLLRHQELLQCLLQHPQVKLYLHGHTHTLHHRVWTKDQHELLSLDSGSSLIGEQPTWGIYTLTREQIISKWFEIEQATPWELGSFTKGLSAEDSLPTA